MPGGGSRWNAGKDLSWVPLRIERVAEVTFGQLQEGRFRHGSQFLRWRPDREPGVVPLRPARGRQPGRVRLGRSVGARRRATAHVVKPRLSGGACRRS